MARDDDGTVLPFQRGQAKHTGVTPGEVKRNTKRRPAGSGRLCAAQLVSRKGTCKRPAGYGTDHLGSGRCKNHGGSTRNGAKAAAREEAQRVVADVKATMTFYGKRVDIEPAQALLEEMQRSAGVVRWLEDALSQWPITGLDAERAARVGKAISAQTDDGDTREAEDLAAEAWEAASDIQTGLPQLVAIHTTTRAVGFTDTEYAAWIKVNQIERAHLAKVAKMCHDAGISERVAVLLERRADLMRRVLAYAMDELGATVEPDRFAAVVRAATQRVALEASTGRGA